MSENELKDALESTREENMRLRAILDHLGDLITIQDEQYRILYQNKRSRDLVGSHVGEHCYSAYEGKSAPCRACALREAFLDGGVHRIEKVVPIGGDPRDLELTASRIPGPAGRCLGGVEIVRDITDRKKAERGLQETNARLIQALEALKSTQAQVIRQERLRALGVMAAGIAHDFNNALMPILAYTDLLLQLPGQLENLEVARKHLGIIRSAALGAAAVVRRLRDFYRGADRNELSCSAVLPDLVQRVVPMTQPKWKDQALARGVRVEMVLRLDPVPPIRGNADQLVEAIANLIFNSVDAMDRDGRITITTRAEGGEVLLEVADTGRGMPEEVRLRCFEPFFTTRSAEEGTGLGLAVVHGVILRHEGRIEVDSRVGEGTRIRLWFPVPASAPASAGSSPAASDPARSLRILIVDDEEPVRGVIVASLQALGHQATAAKDGDRGLEAFRAQAFDLVITDQAMPAMNGTALAEAMKRCNPAVPVILLSGFGDAIQEDGRLPEGVHRVLAKPVTLHQLRDAIAALTATDPGACGPR